MKLHRLSHRCCPRATPDITDRDNIWVKAVRRHPDGRTWRHRRGGRPSKVAGEPPRKPADLLRHRTIPLPPRSVPVDLQWQGGATPPAQESCRQDGASARGRHWPRPGHSHWCPGKRVGWRYRQYDHL